MLLFCSVSQLGQRLPHAGASQVRVRKTGMAVVVVKVILLMALSLSAAFGDCNSALPREVVAPVGWRVLDLTDLAQDDRQMWEHVHAGRCPGVAVGRFASGSRDSYAVALLKNGTGRELLQQLIVWLWAEGHFSAITLVGPRAIVAGPFVVWMTPPGKAFGIDGKRPIRIVHDSFVYEKMEAVATQYYYLNGRFHTLQTAE